KYMQFEINPSKSKINLAKHGLSLEQAIPVFDDPSAYTFGAHIENGEERLKTLGALHGVVIVLVVHTYHESDEGEIIRLISARKADKTERKMYENNSSY
ncbi:MAG: hypothetical protein RL761_330, partial [Pseudomonadota bacterium]